MQRQDDTRQQPPNEDSGGRTQRQTHPAALRGEEHTQLYAQPIRDKPVSAGRTILSYHRGHDIPREGVQQLYHGSE